jgi:hypothetical protein
MQITGSVSIEISKSTEAQIFNGFLHKLMDELWVLEPSEADKYRPAGIYKTIDMQGRGSDVDELITKDLDDPKYVVQVAAFRLHYILMQANNRQILYPK